MSWCATTRSRMGLNPLVSVAVGMLMLSHVSGAAGKDGAKLAPPLMEYFQSVTLVIWLKHDSHEVAGQSKHGPSSPSKVESLQLNAVKVNSSKLSHSAPSVAICKSGKGTTSSSWRTKGEALQQAVLHGRQRPGLCNRMPMVEVHVTSQNTGSLSVDAVAKPLPLKSHGRVLDQPPSVSAGFHPRRRKNPRPRTIESPGHRRH